MNQPSEEKFEMWARVDLFGHNQRAGKLGVTNTGVEVLYRLDIPTTDGFTTEFYGKGAVYSILPVSEEAARLIANKLGAAQPISSWDLPTQWREALSQYKQLPAPERAGEGDTEDDDQDDGDDDHRADDTDDSDDPLPF